MAEATQFDAEAFKKHFSTIEPLIREEWPEVDTAALEQTEGNHDQVVDLVAEQTEHTKALVKRQLRELAELTVDEQSEELIGKVERRLKEAKTVLESLQTKATDMASYVRRDMLPEAKTKATEHPIAVLLMAIGLGFVLGFILRGSGRGR